MDDPVTVIDFETLREGTGPPRHDGRLVIENGVVSGVVARDASPPAGAVHLRGRAVVPGLINAHAHLEQDAGLDPAATITTSSTARRAVAAAEHARRALRAGVTAMRDLGSSAGIALEVRNAIDDGVLTGPTVRAAGRVICMTGGHGAFAGREADGPWAVRAAVRAEAHAGADCIKFVATGGVITHGTVPAREQLSEEELAAGVDEARRHGLRSAAHAIGTRGIVNAVRAGVDSVEHGFLIDDEGIELMLERGTRLVPTLSALRGIVDAGPEAGLPAAISAKAGAIAAEAEHNLRRAREAGVAIVAGSDAGTPFNSHDGYGRELRFLQTMLGMSPEQALRAATVDAAELLDLDRGTLGPGAVADLVVLDHDIDHPEAFVRPASVLRAGRPVG